MIAASWRPIFNQGMESKTDECQQGLPLAAAERERALRLHRFELRFYFAVCWLYCATFALGVWSFFFGEAIPEGEHHAPWTTAMYLGIPIAATVGVIATLLVGRHLATVREMRVAAGGARGKDFARSTPDP